MKAMNEAHRNSSATLLIERQLKAPRELVWKVWSQAEHMKKWWGPKNWDLGVLTFEFKPGGRFHYSMTAPDGNVGYGVSQFVEIVEPERIVFYNSFADDAGNPVKPGFSADYPLRVLNILTFEADGNETRLRMEAHPDNASQSELDFYRNMHDNLTQGFGGTLEQLAKYLDSLS